MIDELLTELRSHTLAHDTPQAFAGLCKAVYALRKYFSKEVTYQDPMTRQRLKFDDLMLEYGLDKTYTSRLIASREKYFEGDLIKQDFMFFTKWKLFYLLVVPSSVLEPALKSGRISAKSSVKQIRKFVTKYKSTVTPSTDKDEQIEMELENLPVAYNPEQFYDFDTVNGWSRGELVNNFWTLQKKYLKGGQE